MGNQDLSGRFAATDSSDAAIETRLLRSELAARMFGDPPDPVVVGRFEILRELGAGGMGRVYLARDPKLRREVAIKLLHGSASSERLVREARSMAKISDPNVVQIFDVGTLDQARLFIAMEFVEGTTLNEWCSGGRDKEDIVRIFAAAGDGLAAAHRAGVMHRDFKPANVLVSNGGVAKVTDFGLSASERGLPNAEKTQGGPRDESLTATGAILGTPAYMAPEQREGAKASEAADQFAFCVALFEALYGERPRTADGPDALRRQIAAVARQQPGSERARFSAIARGLEWEPKARWGTLDGLLAHLRPKRRRRRWLVSVGIAVLFGMGLAASFLNSGPAGVTEVTDHRDQTVRSGSPSPLRATGAPQLAEAETLARRGLIAEAVARNLEAIAVADTLGEPRDRSAARVQAGTLAVLDGRYAEAQALLEDAFEISTEAGDDRSRSEAAARLVFVAGYLNRRPIEGRQWVRHTESLLPRLDEPELLVARLHRNHGLLELGEGKFAEAREHFERALEIRTTVLGAEHPDVAEVYGNLGALAFTRRDFLSAKRNYARSLAILERTLGPRHVWIAMALDDLGSAELELGDAQTAQRRFDRGFAIREHLRPGHPHLIGSWTSLGWAALEAGDHALAEQRYGRALEIAIETYGESHPQAARALADLGVVLRDDGRLAEALGLFVRALVANESTLGPDHEQTIRCQETLASIRAELGTAEG